MFYKLKLVRFLNIKLNKNYDDGDGDDDDDELTGNYRPALIKTNCGQRMWGGTRTGVGGYCLDEETVDTKTLGRPYSFLTSSF